MYHFNQKSSNRKIDLVSDTEGSPNDMSSSSDILPPAFDQFLGDGKAPNEAAATLSHWAELPVVSHEQQDRFHLADSPKNPTCEISRSQQFDKENRVKQMKKYDKEFSEIGNDKELRKKFDELGIPFSPEILVSIGMTESGGLSQEKEPAGFKTKDNDLGIMQLRPTKNGDKYEFDPNVAKALGWDNSISLEENLKNSNWKNPKANIYAGSLNLANQAKYIRKHIPDEKWNKLSPEERLNIATSSYNDGYNDIRKQYRQGGIGKINEHPYAKSVNQNLSYFRQQCKVANPKAENSN